MMLIKRNILIYFRDRRNVIFSLYAVFFMIGVYLLFLSRTMEAALRNMLELDATFNIGPIMTSIVLAGMIASTAVTSGQIGIFRFVADKEGPARDFFTTPISRRKIIASYVIGAAIIGLIMTGATLAVSLVYLAINGGVTLGGNMLARLALTAALTALCANAFVFLLTTLAKTRESFNAIINLVSAMIGFMLGVFIPIGNLPDSVGWIIRLFPLTHGASMFRQVLADEALYSLFYTVQAPSEYLEEFREFFGIALRYGGFVSSFWFSAGVLAAAAAVFYGVGLWIIAYKKVVLAE